MVKRIVDVPLNLFEAAELFNRLEQEELEGCVINVLDGKVYVSLKTKLSVKEIISYNKKENINPDGKKWVDVILPNKVGLAVFLSELDSDIAETFKSYVVCNSMHVLLYSTCSKEELSETANRLIPKY